MSEDCICKCNANWILLIKWKIYGLTTRSLSTLEIMSLLNLNSCHPVGIKDQWIRFIVSTHYALRSMICHKMILSKHFSTLIRDLILSGYKKTGRKLSRGVSCHTLMIFWCCRKTVCYSQTTCRRNTSIWCIISIEECTIKTEWEYINTL